MAKPWTRGGLSASRSTVDVVILTSKSGCWSIPTCGCCVAFRPSTSHPARWVGGGSARGLFTLMTHRKGSTHVHECALVDLSPPFFSRWSHFHLSPQVFVLGPLPPRVPVLPADFSADRGSRGAARAAVLAWGVFTLAPTNQSRALRCSSP